MMSTRRIEWVPGIPPTGLFEGGTWDAERTVMTFRRVDIDHCRGAFEVYEGDLRLFRIRRALFRFYAHCSFGEWHLSVEDDRAVDTIEGSFAFGWWDFDALAEALAWARDARLYSRYYLTPKDAAECFKDIVEGSRGGLLDPVGAVTADGDGVTVRFRWRTPEEVAAARKERRV